MKVISQDAKGTLVEFANLRQHTNVIGALAPVRALIPPGKFGAFKKSSDAAAQAGQDAAARFKMLVSL